jgi:hypothetical protein
MRTPEIRKWLLRHSRFQLHFTRPVPPGSTLSTAGSPIGTRDYFRFLTFRHVPSHAGCLSVFEDVIVEPTIEKLQTLAEPRG